MSDSLVSMPPITPPKGVHLYRVKEIFSTIQGEGYWAGKAAVFVRLAGCNLWTGREQDRHRDAARHQAHCPRWCDTDFVGGLPMSAEQVAGAVRPHLLAGTMIVLSGGEPGLQVDDKLIEAMADLLTAGPARVCIETNGTIDLFKRIRKHPRLWVTMSPKVARKDTPLDRADELKLVFPSYDPAEWDTYPVAHKYLQPEAAQSVLQASTMLSAADYVRKHPTWRLSCQVHKVIGVP